MKKLLIATILSTAAFAANAEAPEAAAQEAIYPPEIGFEQAKAIAVDAVKNSIKVVEAELELEEGEGFTYEIEVEAGGVVTEVEIDATTGKVLEMEADD